MTFSLHLVHTYTHVTEDNELHLTTFRMYIRTQVWQSEYTPTQLHRSYTHCGPQPPHLLHICTGHEQWLTQWWIWAMLLPWQHQAINITFSATHHAQWPGKWQRGSQFTSCSGSMDTRGINSCPNPQTQVHTYIVRSTSIYIHMLLIELAPKCSLPQACDVILPAARDGKVIKNALPLSLVLQLLDFFQELCRKLGFRWSCIGVGSEGKDGPMGVGRGHDTAGQRCQPLEVIGSSLSLFPSPLSPSCVQALHFVSHFCHINITSAHVTSLSS